MVVQVTCEWCYTAEATGTVELKPARRKKDARTGVYVIAKPAQKIQVCRGCKQKVERQLDDAARRAANA